MASSPATPANNDDREEKLFKVIVCGDYAVGKTSLIRRYCEGLFSPNYKLTIGVDFSVKSLEWDPNTTVTLQIWDIAGHERFGCMTSAYYKHCIAAIIVFDVTRQTTLDSVAKWKEDINSKVVLANGQPVPTLLLANKSDMGEPINAEELDEYCRRNGFVGWFHTSARDNVNVDDAMNFIVTKILQVAEDNIPRETATDVVRLDSGSHRGGAGGVQNSTATKKINPAQNDSCCF